MAKTLEISFEDNLKGLERLYGDLAKRAYPTATRRALNKGMGVEFTSLDKKVRALRRIKKKELKKFLRKQPTREKRMENMVTEVRMSGRKIPLVFFVVGKKEPRKQSGIGVRKRRKIKIEVRKGKRITLKRAFIAKGRRGKNQVFRRRTKKRFPIVAQKLASVAKLVQIREIEKPIRIDSRRTIVREMNRQVALWLSKRKVSKKTRKRVA